MNLRLYRNISGFVSQRGQFCSSIPNLVSSRVGRERPESMPRVTRSTFDPFRRRGPDRRQGPGPGVARDLARPKTQSGFGGFCGPEYPYREPPLLHARVLGSQRGTRRHAFSRRAAAARSARGTRSCACLLYTSPSPRDKRQSRMPSSA